MPLLVVAKMKLNDTYRALSTVPELSEISPNRLKTCSTCCFNDSISTYILVKSEPKLPIQTQGHTLKVFKNINCYLVE